MLTQREMLAVAVPLVAPGRDLADVQSDVDDLVALVRGTYNADDAIGILVHAHLKTDHILYRRVIRTALADPDGLDWPGLVRS